MAEHERTSCGAVRLLVKMLSRFMDEIRWRRWQTSLGSIENFFVGTDAPGTSLNADNVLELRTALLEEKAKR